VTGVSRRAAVVIFLAFAFAYFLSALLRGVTATLAPVFSSELGLRSADLGLLAGAYFLGFAALQLPLGRALDRHGPRRTLLVLLAVAVLGCLAFAQAGSLWGLIAARALIGAGVAACLMAPLTSYRHLYTPSAQLRANSWMLMTGSLGMVAATLPVQWLLPSWGWRGLFWCLAGLLVVAMVLVAWRVPVDVPEAASAAAPEVAAQMAGPGYGAIVRHPLFLRMAPLGFFVYGGLIAVQALWAGPWMTRVGGASAAQAAQGLFIINLAMLVAFMAWGAVMPQLARHGLSAVWLMARGLPLCLGLLFMNVALGPAAGAWHWAAWCAACTFVSVSQPALGQAFARAQAGRALSAFNLVIFGGVFFIQWGMGLLIDAFTGLGWTPLQAFRATFAVFGVCGVLSYGWFLRPQPAAADNPG
jgi:predicted MFS family arabinose efflux permease